jgi:ABC-type transport system involved in multi-copper enzyme maturation permease subunit
MSNNNQSHYLAGMQEVVGKTVSFIFTTAGFVIFALAGVGQIITLNPINVFAYLALFWFVYELITFVLYVLFSMFLNDRSKSAPTPTPEQPVDETI